MISVDQAFIALLAGFRVNQGDKDPQDKTTGGWQGAPGTSAFHNYLIVTPGHGLTDGTAAHLDADVEREYTVQCVAATATGAGILAANVATAVSGKTIKTASRQTRRPITVERWGKVDPDDTVQPRLYMVAHVFSVATTTVT